jgi:hypothetical protein
MNNDARKMHNDAQRCTTMPALTNTDTTLFFFFFFFFRQLHHHQPLRILTQQFLNMITGSHPRSEDLWAEEVIVQMESRFGVRCLSSLERKNLSRYAAVVVVVVATCVVWCCLV